MKRSHAASSFAGGATFCSACKRSDRAKKNATTRLGRFLRARCSPDPDPDPAPDPVRSRRKLARRVNDRAGIEAQRRARAPCGSSKTAQVESRVERERKLDPRLSTQNTSVRTAPPSVGTSIAAGFFSFSSRSFFSCSLRLAFPMNAIGMPVPRRTAPEMIMAVAM